MTQAQCCGRVARPEAQARRFSQAHDHRPITAEIEHCTIPELLRSIQRDEDLRAAITPEPQPPPGRVARRDHHCLDVVMAEFHKPHSDRRIIDVADDGRAHDLIRTIHNVILAPLSQVGARSPSYVPALSIRAGNQG